MISAYHFSLTGRDHTARNMPCHDYSLIREVSASWKIAIVADGVGSCAHADIAAKTAAEAAADLIEKQFPPSSAEDADYISVIIAAMHGAANAIEAYVSKNDDGNEEAYQTTLALAILSKRKLYYGNAGDSGIIGLDAKGSYHVLSHKQNDDIGQVYAIPSSRCFEVGTADFVPAAAICLTDGVLDFVAPAVLKDFSYQVDVPFANLFCAYALGIDPAEEPEAREKSTDQLKMYLSSDHCSDMRDDLSAAVLTLTDSELLPEDIAWERPEIDTDLLKWREVSVYPEENTRITAFMEYLKKKYPSMTSEQLDAILQKYLKPSANTESDPVPDTNSSPETTDAQAQKLPAESRRQAAPAQNPPDAENMAGKKSWFGLGTRRKEK